MFRLRILPDQVANQIVPGSQMTTRPPIHDLD
jgi:hypothetical protein